MKLIFLGICIFNLFCFILNGKYLIKKKPKIPEVMEWNVPEVPGKFKISLHRNGF
jgi:hypothetical protein